jgi:ATP-dependent RNA helicase DeaD
VAACNVCGRQNDDLPHGNQHPMTDPNTASLTPSSEGTSEQALAAPAEVVLAQTFEELKLSQRVLESVNAAGFLKPTPIQAQFIPVALTGNDVMGQAKTGTGKTGSFLIPIFEQIHHVGGLPQALILAPTRELALQIQGEIARLGSLLGFSSITLYGGSSYEPQIEALAHGVDIIVGTPGRVMDHMRSGRLDLSDVKIAVLDEADRMLDLGFRRDIEYILSHCPKDRQTLLLSATIPDEIKKLAQRFMYEPLEVWTSPERMTVDAVEQFYVACERTEKLAVLLKLLEMDNPPLAIVFCGTKIGAKKLAERLKRLYISAREIHGDLQQSKRERIMGNFRSGKVRLLIATDVASRGIDVNDITHIYNYDIPYKIEDYVHRIGRTGRMEKSGKAYTLVTREEAQYLTEIELLINREITRLEFDDLTSKWWPKPPTEPPADYEEEEAGPASENAPVLHGNDRKKGRSRGPRGERGGRGGRSERGGRGGSSHSGGRSQPAPAAAASQSPGNELHAAGAAMDHLETPPLQITAVPQDHNYEDEAEAGGEAEGVSGNGSTPGGEGTSAEGTGRRKRRRRKKTGEPVAIVCAACGKQATVRFKPDPSRPVYCSDCYKVEKAAKAPAETVSEIEPEVEPQKYDPDEANLGNLDSRE